MASMYSKWENIKLHQEKLTFLANLGGKHMQYVRCDSFNNTCESKKIYKNRVTPSYYHESSWSGGTPVCPYGAYLNESSGLLVCDQNDFFFVTTGTYGDNFIENFLSYMNTFDCNTRYLCRGPLDIAKTLDLGTAQAWTMYPGRNVPLIELGLSSYTGVANLLFQGTVNARYDFDFESEPMDDARMLQLATWQGDLFASVSVTSSTANGGPGPLGAYLAAAAAGAQDLNLALKGRDMAFVLGIVNYTYDAFYTPAFFTNSFYNKNVLSTRVLNRSIEEFVGKAGTIFAQYYRADIVNLTAIQTVVRTLIKAPLPSQDANLTPVLTLFLSRKQMLQLLKNPTTAASAYISTFLRDKEATFRRPGADKMPCVDPVLSFAGYTDVRAQMMSIDSTSQAHALGPLLTINAAGDFVPSSTDQTYSRSPLIVAHYQVRTTIARWSIMLAAYFESASYIPPNFSTATCDAMATRDLPLVTRVCFDKADATRQAAYTKTSCPVEYTPPTGVTGHTNWLLYANAIDPYGGGEACQCYNANLGQPQDLDDARARMASRCFSVQCNKTQRESARLTDTVCSEQDICAKVAIWMKSKNPAQRGFNPDNFDWARFGLLCNEVIQPLADMTYDWRMALSITATLLALSLWAAILARRQRERRPMVYWLCLVGPLVALSFAAGILSGWALAGVPGCASDGTEYPSHPVCRSRVFGTPLLLSSCPYVANCECQFDRECGSGCSCATGFCTSRSGQRKTKLVSQTSVDVVVLMPLLASALVVPWILMATLPRTSVWKTRLANCIAASTCLALLAAAYFASVRVDPSVLVFEKSTGCGYVFPRIVSLVDSTRNVSVTFPTDSYWTTSGVASSANVTQSPFSIPSALLSIVVVQIKKVYPDFDTTHVARSYLFVNNSADDPAPSSFYVFTMLPAHSGRGNTVAVSRVQNQRNVQIDVWTCAWGKLDLPLDLMSVLAPEVTITSIAGTARSGSLYSQATVAASAQNARVITGPRALDAVVDAEFFLQARRALGAEWDGQRYDVALAAIQPNSTTFYVMQIPTGLAVACSKASGGNYECLVGRPSLNLNFYPSRPSS